MKTKRVHHIFYYILFLFASIQNNTSIAAMMWPFTSPSPSISDRLEALRAAEAKLLEYAKTRFGGGHHNGHHHPPGDEDDDDGHHHRHCSYELFDTPVSIPSVLRRDPDTGRIAMQFPSPSSPSIATSSSATSDVDVDDGERLTLHGVKVTNERHRAESSSPSSSSSPPPHPPLVLLHGYANGSLYFYRNLFGLSRHFRHVYALDLLGWGLSSRPTFDLHADDVVDDAPSSPTPEEEEDSERRRRREDGGRTTGSGSGSASARRRRRVAAAESFFVESLESWREHHDLDKMTLAGHSMGGYLAAAYAERHPDRVHKLVLLSPVGLPRRPEPEEEARAVGSLPFVARCAIKTARYLFESRGITPGDFLRSLPASRSRSMVESYVGRRLPALSCPEERAVLGEYLYQNSMLPGSGEYCLGEILTAGAYARMPLVDRIPDLGGGGRWRCTRYTASAIGWITGAGSTPTGCSCTA